jgi:hypothetical protein
LGEMCRHEFLPFLWTGGRSHSSHL